jgi:hypothetical protein
MREHPRSRIGRLISSCSFVSFVVMFLLSLGCTIGGEPKHPAWKNATGAEQYERLMWQSIRDKDWKEVEYRLAPLFSGVSASGQLFDRGSWVEHWKAVPVTDFTLAEVQVYPNGPGMAVTYVLHLNGAPAAGLRVVSVWQQVKGGWILTTTTHTPIQGP